MVYINKGTKKRKRKRNRQRQRKQSCDHEVGPCAKCSGMTDAERYHRIKHNIEKYGLHLAAVGAGESSPNFTYSIGLTKKGFSELIIFGLPFEFSAYYISMIGDEMLEGKVFEQDVSHFGYTKGDCPFMLLEVPQDVANNYMGDTKRYYPNFKTRQFVWTDAEGKYPWDENFNDNLINRQIILGKIPNK